jgi:hypothetical protein
MPVAKRELFLSQPLHKFKVRLRRAREVGAQLRVGRGGSLAFARSLSEGKEQDAETPILGKLLRREKRTGLFIE